MDFENSFHNLCCPYDGFSGVELEQQNKAKGILLGVLNLIGKYLDSLPRRAKGPIEAANRSLIARTINDLLVAFHAISAGFYAQGANLLRPILESANLIMLFQKDPSKIGAWLEGGLKARKELPPGKVRVALYGEDGEDPFEEMYSHFCETGTHPRFSGSKSHIVKKTPDETEANSPPQIIAFIGGRRIFPTHTVNLLNCIAVPMFFLLAIFQVYPEMIEVDEHALFGYFEQVISYCDYLPELPAKAELIKMAEKLGILKMEFERLNKA